MTTGAKMANMALFFVLSVKERKNYLEGFTPGRDMAYDEDGTTTDNPLYFFCVSYLDLVATIHNTEITDECTVYREIISVLSALLNLPVGAEYVWNYDKDAYSGGVFDDLWLVVARLSRTLIDTRSFTIDRLMGVNELISELL